MGVLVGGNLPAVGSVAAHFQLGQYSGDDSVEIDNDRLPPFGATPGNFYNRARDALEVWTLADPLIGFDFHYEAQRSMPNTYTEVNVTQDETWIMDYWLNDTCTPSVKCWDWPSTGCPAGQNCYLGNILYARIDNEISRVLILINHDDDIPWFQGTGTPGASQFDLWSAMVHEFGHAVGIIEHIVDVDCTHPGALTMCGSKGLHKGTTEMRTLEPHEDADFTNAY
jgi:hypothetical protein